MISASAADSHRFGRVKRNGYDPVEVDAVVARLVEAIRKHEKKTDTLEQRLSEADASADAIRKTFVAVESTRDEMLAEARSEAQRLSSDAEREAEEILSQAQANADGIVSEAHLEAERVAESAEASAKHTADLAKKIDSEVAAHRDRILAEAYDEAERIMIDAELSVSERVTVAAFESEQALETARNDAERARRVGGASLRAALIASAWVRREASLTADRIVSGAEASACVIKDDAEREAREAQIRADQLRRAISGLDDAARQLADLTTEGLAVIDLAEIEAADAAASPDLVLPPVSEPDKWATRSAARDVEIDEVPTPLMSVAEATAALDEDEEPTPEEPDSEEPTTYYQRSTGTPLSERVKIARRSG